MSLNMNSFTQALAKTAAVIEKTVHATVQEVTGPRALQDYTLLDQIGTAGPGLVWKLYAGRAVRAAAMSQQYPTVCIWILDKRALSESRARAGLSKTSEDAFLDIIRADASRLVRLRHPGVVHVVQALDENKNAMAMVTEPLSASLANALGFVDDTGKSPKEYVEMKMGILEIKHGLLKVAETLNFLHNNAQLIHRGLSPENVFITLTGAWKLGGFGFSISLDQAAGGLTNVQVFHYAEYDSEDSIIPLHPSLNYTAPEFVMNNTSSASCSSDIFSFGCIAYHLIAHKSLLECHNNVRMYMNSLTYISSEAFFSIPAELIPDLQRMISSNTSSRPTALDFTASPFFRDDTRLRALRFLDHMLETDNIQKSEFLKALSDMWKDFDSRILRYKVLPPLCAELRNLVMQPIILPMVLTIAESQEKVDFEQSTLPALIPVLNVAAGETLLLLLKHTELIMNKTTQEQLISHLLPMLLRSYNDNDSRIQEEALRLSLPLSKKLDTLMVKQTILPRVHTLALRTTAAAVRVNALLYLSDLVRTLDRPDVLEILQTVQRCTAVDRSPPTLMCTLGIANSILKQFGVEFTAEHVLPLLSPLLVSQQLNTLHFSKYIFFVKDVLRMIEEKRGVATNAAGTSVLNPPPSSRDGSTTEAFNVPSGPVSTSRRSRSWNEDLWAPPREPGSNPQPRAAELPSTNSYHQHADGSHETPALYVSPAAAAGVEWPPPAALGRIDALDQLRPSSPKSLSSLNGSGIGMNHQRNGQKQSHSSSSTGMLGYPMAGIAMQEVKKQSSWQGEAGGIQEGRMGNLGSIFGEGNGDNRSPLRLAPPPVSSVSRGGKGRWAGSKQGNRKNTDGPPLLDLL